MSSKLLTIGSLCITGALVPLGATAQAGNINTSGTICQNFNAAQALDIDYFTTAVRNVNAAARPVVCSVPRSPLPTGTTPQFFVDGHNNASTCTTCTLTMYRFTGVIAATQSFTQCAPATGATTWDHLVSFPSLPGPDTFDYASLLCTLPANGAGLLYGVTTAQP